jgi:hypothetical protein
MAIDWRNNQKNASDLIHLNCDGGSNEIDEGDLHDSNIKIV